MENQIKNFSHLEQENEELKMKNQLLFKEIEESLIIIYFS